MPVTTREIVSALRRRWWLVVIVPAIVLPLAIVRTRTQPFQTSVNAVVLLPGDTEDPGNSERPELMVMDDLPALITSRVYAEAVAQQLGGDGATSELAGDVGAIEGMLSATRYSRVLTITVESGNSGDAMAVANAAAAVLPAQVNSYLVADPSRPATVQIIDPPGDPTRSRPNQTLIILALTLVATAVGAGLALVADQWSRPQRNQNAVGKAQETPKKT
jgi:capsular polysaccharide biosynthesis protein